MQTVDPSLPFKVVYSIYHHEYLGFLIAPHVIQILPDGQLSFIHQALYPENLGPFRHCLDETDLELISALAEISPNTIIKKYGGSLKDALSFFSYKFVGEIKKMGLSYIQRRKAKILPLLTEKEVYEMGHDGYAAHTEVEVLKEKATVLFHFRRNESEVRYFPTIKLNGTRVDFQYKNAVLIGTQPAWMLLNHQLFTFEQEVEGNKLYPFLKKRYISIPKGTEQEYFKKFVPQILEKYHVYAEGVNIRTVKADPSFSIKVKNHDSSFSFMRQVNYGKFQIPLDYKHPVKVEMEKEGDDYTFFRIKRNIEEEAKVCSFLQEITPSPNSLSPWEYVSKEHALQWLSEHMDRIRSAGIDLVQDNQEYQFTLQKPEVTLLTREAGDWFDIEAVVKIGSFEIPFIKFRKHILKGKREYTLPDGTIAILPENWFAEYRHLLEVGEVQNENGLRIKKYQIPLLNLTASLNGNGTATKLRSYLEALKDTDKIPAAILPQNLKATLRNYQVKGYEWLCFLKDQGMGGILADDMGLGKTLQTLALLQREKELGTEQPTLIILPTSLIYNWKNEARKFTPDLKVFIHSGVNRSKDPEVFAENDLILTTYGIARQDKDMLKTFPFHYIILDESQMIKNPESKTAKAVQQLVCKHRLSLTGTPIENTVMDIWSQMSFLNPGLLGTENFFKKFYVSPIEKDKDSKRSAKLRRIIYPFILRRKKEQVEAELPPKVERVYYCEMTEGQEKFYDETRNTYRNYLMELIHEGTWRKNKLNILTGLQRLRQIAIHPCLLEPEKYELNASGKYQEIRRLLDQILLKKQSKVLIFSQFVKMLQVLKQDLEGHGYRFNYLDGNTKDRQDLVDSFQADPDIRIFLISLKAGGVGLNLTAADYVFILDPWWNPAVENQAVDRSHRIGQKRTVFYYKFITLGTIEEKILRLQQKKAQLSDDIIQVEEDIYKSLTEDDIGELLA